MYNFKNILNKYKYYFIIFVLLLILIPIILSKSGDKVKAESKKDDIKITEKKEEKEVIKTVKVDIKGEVINPGVYELKENDRVIDAINVSGGLTKNADTNYINLSKKLTDEMHIVIYSKEEIKSMKNSDPIIIYMEKECICPSVSNDACITSNLNQNNNLKNSKVNINNALVEELEQLTSIGKSKAEAIIEYRKENKFNTIEDIKNVPGIGESIYSKIKDNITI